jgi:uncharacterized protein (TIGR02246 family)
MKPIFILSIALTIVLVIMTSCAPQRPDPAQVRKAIEDADARIVKAFEAKDDSASASVYAEDAIVLAPNSPMIKGREGIRAFHKAALPTLHDFKIKTVKIEVADSLAYEIGEYIMTIQPPNAPAIQDTGKYVEVFKLQPNGSWLIVADIFNSNLPLPPPEAKKKK